MKCLTPQQRITLVEARDHHPKPYVRERAAAILKVAEGGYFQDVAHQGLLKRHAARTVSTWYHRFLKRGVIGLFVDAGRGRKPAHFP
jgi:hypothetical protein